MGLFFPQLLFAKQKYKKMDLSLHIKDLIILMGDIFIIKYDGDIYTVTWENKILYLKESPKYVKKKSLFPSAPIFDKHQEMYHELFQYKIGEEDTWQDVISDQENGYSFTDRIKEYLEYNSQGINNHKFKTN